VRGRVLVGLAARKEDDSGHRCRHVLVEALQRHVGDLVDRGTVGRFVTGQDHVRLEQRAAEIESLIVQLRVDSLQHAAGGLAALADRMRPVLQDLGLHDRDDVGFLA
jgi:hypothetical protein